MGPLVGLIMLTALMASGGIGGLILQLGKGINHISEIIAEWVRQDS